MGFPALILPEDWLAPVMPTTIDRSVLEPSWSKRRSLCQSVRAARPQEGTEEETAALMALVQLAFDFADAIGPEFLVALRAGVERGLMVIIEAELREAPVQRKLALRYIERAIETFGLFVASASELMRTTTPDAMRSVFGVLAEQAREGRFSLDDDSRSVFRFELYLMMAFDSLGAADEELAYWAMKAVSSARQVQAVQLPKLPVSMRGELARLRARHPWDGWDSVESDREFAPWTSPGR